MIIGPRSSNAFKRLSALLVLLLVCLSIFPGAQPVQAVSDLPAAVISIDHTSVTKGGTTVVTVKAQGIQSPGLAGYDFKIGYDPVALNLIGLSRTSDYPAPTTEFSASQPNPSTVAGEILVNSAYVEVDTEGKPLEKTGEIELFSLTFVALSTTAQSILTLDVKDFADSDLLDIPHTINNGSISVLDPPTPSMTVSPTMLTEASANDGSLASGDIFLTLANGTFATDIGTSDVSINGLPEGMGFTVSSPSDSELKLTLTGQATSHDNMNDTTLTITVAQAKVNGALADLTGTIGLDFLSNGSTPSILSVVATPASQTTGKATNVSIGVTCVGISTGTPMTVELINSDGSSLSPVALSSSTVQNDSATVTLNVPISVAPGSYKLKVVSAGVTNNSSTYSVLPMFGDVNSTGDVNITDALQVLKAITNPSLFNSTQRIVADVNGDSSVNITDALLILKHITNPIPFPIEN